MYIAMLNCDGGRLHHLVRLGHVQLGYGLCTLRVNIKNVHFENRGFARIC